MTTGNQSSVPQTSVASTLPAPKGSVRKTYLTLDAWRGLSALAVVCFHWSELVVRRWPELEGNWLYHLSHYGNVGVQIFFVISGYVIANAGAVNLERQLGIKKFVTARVRRIYPTYWAALLLSMLVVYFGYKMAQHGAAPQNIFTQANPFVQSPLAYFINLTLTNLAFITVGNYSAFFLMVAWTLCYEVAFYCIVAGMMAFARTPQRMLWGLHAITVVGLLWLIVSPATCPYPLNLWPQFGLGVLVYDYLSGRSAPDNNPGNKALVPWIATLTGLTLILVVRPDFYINSWVVSSRLAYGISLIFAFALVLLSKQDTRLSQIWLIKILSALGVFSYSLYLTHTTTIRLVNQFMLRLQLPHEAHWIAFVLALVVAVGVAYIFFLLFEKPLLRGGKKSPKPVTSEGVLPARDGTPASDARGTAV